MNASLAYPPVKSKVSSMFKFQCIRDLVMMSSLIVASPKVLAEPTLPWPQPTQVLRLWEGDAPGLVTPAKAEEIVNQRIRNVSVPELWAYLPEKRDRKRTAILICPGGGYVHHAMGLHVGNVVQLFQDQEIVVFGLKYRTRYGANQVEDDAVADCARAVRMIRKNAETWGIDRIGVQGYSAGGNVALNLLGRFDQGQADAVDPVERFSSRPDFVALMCPWANGKPITSYPLKPNLPPVFIASAEDDNTAPLAFAEEIAAAVKQQGGEVKMFVVPDGGHSAFHYGVSKGDGAKWPEALLKMIRK